MGPVLQNIFAKSVQEVGVCLKIKYILVELGEQLLIRTVIPRLTSDPANEFFG